jgi:hypothetical protein
LKLLDAAFAKKVTRSEDCNDRFLALLGKDGEFDLALLDVTNRVRDRRETDVVAACIGSLAK